MSDVRDVRAHPPTTNELAVASTSGRATQEFRKGTEGRINLLCEELLQVVSCSDKYVIWSNDESIHRCRHLFNVLQRRGKIRIHHRSARLFGFSGMRVGPSISFPTKARSPEHAWKEREKINRAITESPLTPDIPCSGTSPVTQVVDTLNSKITATIAAVKATVSILVLLSVYMQEITY